MAGSAAGDCRCAATTDGNRLDRAGNMVSLSKDNGSKASRGFRLLCNSEKRHDTACQVAMRTPSGRKVRSE